MYGLLLESIADYLMETYGTDKWEEIRKKASITNISFSTHTRYPEKTISCIARVAAEVTGEDEENLMNAFGTSFVRFVTQFGYDKLLSVLGRHLRDFLNGLDNLHEYLRFSYPKLKAPSFFVENESRTGLTLHYRSKRKGFVRYVEGQICQVAKIFFDTDIEIEILSEEVTDSLTHIIMRLKFDNTAFGDAKKSSDQSIQSMPLRSDVFFNLFPFHVVFNRLLTIRSIGQSLFAVMPLARGKNLKDVFDIARPLMVLSWENIMSHTNNVFELATVQSLSTRRQNFDGSSTKSRMSRQSKISRQSRQSRQYPGDEKKDTEREKDDYDSSEDENENCLRLKGQMLFMSEWDCIVFVGTPVMENLDTMFKSGLYINDLSMHDSSRDLVLAGTQQSAELKLALDQEQQKSKILEESMRRLDEEMHKTDQLLYQMIPKQVADRLRSGEPAMSTCQAFESVSILFSDIVGFTNICSNISPMEVVSMLNAMYTEFDMLSEKHNVYKVETIGDAYMVVAGAPEMTRFHAVNACDMGLGMLDAMKDLLDPSTGASLTIRVGIHSGSTVAGVVGMKMPRYCLFGDTVNTASRMESNSEKNKINISQYTYEEVYKFNYLFEERGSITVKGKGEMKTYWLLGKKTKGGSISAPNPPLPPPVTETLKTGKTESNVRALYSPVSFEDVNKSQANLRKINSPPPITESKSYPVQHVQNSKNDTNKSLTFNEDVKFGGGSSKEHSGKIMPQIELKSQTCVVL